MHTRLVRDLKELSCVIPADAPAKPGVSGEDIAHELPDGQIITMKWEDRVSCPEVLFSPSDFIVDIEGKSGICDIAVRSVQSCDRDLQKSVFGNVVVAGG